MRRCLACRAVLVRTYRGRRKSYCNIRCLHMARRLNTLCNYRDVLPDLLLLPLATWQRAMWFTMRENEGA